MITYEYKLYNNENYQKRFDSWLGCARMVYNLAKETKDHAYRQFGINLTAFDLINQLPELKKECPWLKEVGAPTLQQVIERLDDSFKKFFKGGGYPKWAKKGRYKSFVIKQQNKNDLRQTEKGFKLPKFGEVKVFNNKRKINGKIKRAVLKQKADGLYLLVVFEPIKKETFLVESQDKIVAIDMGLKYFYVTSEGEFVDNPKHLEKYLKQLRIENRGLSRKKKGSKNWYKQIAKLKKLYKTISDTRVDFLHKQSTDLSNKYNTVIREDLNIKDMVKNKHLSRHISDVSWEKFFELLEYKTNVIKVNPKYTSQKCSACGHIAKENRPTQSLFECVECGFTENADYNSSKNILKLGHQLLYDNVRQ